MTHDYYEQYRQWKMEGEDKIVFDEEYKIYLFTDREPKSQFAKELVKSGLLKVIQQTGEKK